MAAPTTWNTSPQSGVDVTTYYAGISASLTPETPAPPFAVGAIMTGNQGTEFVFVQASTTIALGDFVAIQNGFFATSLTNTNVISSLGCQIGMAATVVAQSVTLIPAGAFFWAAIRGSSLSGNAATATTAGAPVQLYTTATAGAIASVTASAGAALAGIECVSSVTPIFKLTWPRTIVIYSSATGQASIFAEA